MQVMDNPDMTYHRRNCDTIITNVVADLLLLPLFTNFLGAVSRIIVGSTIYSTLVIYFIFFAYIVLKLFCGTETKRYLNKVFLIEIVALSLMFINYILFEQSRVYFYANSEQLILILLIYIPVAVYATYVRDWSAFFERGKLCAILTPIVGFVGVRFLNFNSFLSYMHIGVALLPGVLISWYHFSVNKNRIYFAVFLLSFLELVIYGNKMSTLSVIGFIFIILLLKIKNNNESSRKFILTLLLLIVSTILLLNYESILAWAAKTMISFGFESRVLYKFATKRAFEDNSREVLYQFANQELSTMGLRINGLFGDRIALRKYMYSTTYTSDYVHNIFYEFLLSFGWVFGSIFLIVLIWKIIKKIFFERSYSISYIATFFACYSFMRLIVSGSFIIEGPFWLLLGVLFIPEENPRVVFTINGRRI